MDCIIIVRMPLGNITALMDGDTIATFTRDEAIEKARTHILCDAYPFQIVECDEL